MHKCATSKGSKTVTYYDSYPFYTANTKRMWLSARGGNKIHR